MMRKRQLITCIVATISLGIGVAACTSDEDTVENSTYVEGEGWLTKDNIFYRLNGNNVTFAHTADWEQRGTMVIPEQVKINNVWYTVTSIDPFAFQGWDQLSRIEIPATVSTIGERAFQRCTSLTAIALPEAMKAVSQATFQGCTALREVVLPERLKSIGSWAFTGCEALETVVLPATLTSIGDETFANCGLKAIDIPEGVTDIGMGAFDGCKQLRSVSVPSTIKNYASPFTHCDAIETVTTNQWFVLGEFGPNVRELNLGEGVQTIGLKAFADAKKLRNVTCRAVSPPWLPDHDQTDAAFSRETVEEGTLYVPASAMNAYKNAGGWKAFKTVKSL